MIKISLANFAFVFSATLFIIYNYLFFFNVNFLIPRLYDNFVLSFIFVTNNLLNSFLVFCYIYFLCRVKKFFLIFFPPLLFLVIAVLGINVTTSFETASFLIHDMLDNLFKIGFIQLYKTDIIKGLILYAIVLFVNIIIIDFKARRKFKLKKFIFWLVSIYVVSYALFYLTITYSAKYKAPSRKIFLTEIYKNYSQNAFTFPILLNLKSQKESLSEGRKAFLKQNVVSKYNKLYDGANFYSQDQKPRLLVITVGESVNSSHLGVNGYKRNQSKYFVSKNTTPNLEKIKSKIVSFKETSGCSTLTSMEWPCMFFPYTRHDFTNFYDIYFLEDNLPDVFTILAKQGYKIFLIDYEQSLTETSIAKIRSKIKLYNPQYGYIDLGFACNKVKNQKIKNQKRVDCQIKNVIKFIEQHKSEKVAIITYGAGGHSHYQYMYHSQYVTKRHPNKLQHNINKYDGTIMFLDSYLYKLINYLDKNQKNSMMLYISDHGEAVDQGRQHGQSYNLAKQKYQDVLNPATIVWFSESWLQNINKNAMKNARYYRNNTYNHSQVFEDILKCAGIGNKNYIFKKGIC